MYQGTVLNFSVRKQHKFGKSTTILKKNRVIENSQDLKVISLVQLINSQGF